MTAGAIAARERRNVEWEAKRFNVTMREYIEIKHDKIYDEYCSFYKSLACKYPNKKNLTKTSAFKSWKKSAIEQSFREDGVLAEVTDLMGPNDQESEESGSEFANGEEQFGINQTELSSKFANGEEQFGINQTELSSEFANDEEQFGISQAESTPDILSVAMNETLPDIGINGIENADNLIAEIINELEQEGPLQGILAGDDEVRDGDYDEGIALDYQTELEAVVESFDYELEIDF